VILNDQIAIGHCIETDATGCLQLILTLPNENLATALTTYWSEESNRERDPIERKGANCDSQKTEA